MGNMSKLLFRKILDFTLFSPYPCHALHLAECYYETITYLGFCGPQRWEICVTNHPSNIHYWRIKPYRCSKIGYKLHKIVHLIDRVCKKNASTWLKTLKTIGMKSCKREALDNCKYCNNIALVTIKTKFRKNKY